MPRGGQVGDELAACNTRLVVRLLSLEQLPLRLMDPLHRSRWKGLTGHFETGGGRVNVAGGGALTGMGTSLGKGYEAGDDLFYLTVRVGSPLTSG
ncbi:hypothetical protein GCM10009562_35510 [Nocardioides aquaticus]